MKRFLLAIVLVLAMAGSGWTTDYYVDTTSAAGGNGTTQDLSGGNHAWNTITQVNTFATSTGFSPGDNINFRCGQTFSDTYLSLICSGSSTSARVTYQSYQKTGAGDPTDKPIIKNGFTNITTGPWTDDGGGKYHMTYTGSACDWVYDQTGPIKKATTTALTDGNWKHAQSAAFTSGGTAEIVAGDTVVGATSGKSAAVAEVILSTGTWAGGDAAGTLIINSKTGNFTNGEALNVAAKQDDIATLTANFANDRIYYKSQDGDISGDTIYRRTISTGAIFGTVATPQWIELKNLHFYGCSIASSASGTNNLQNVFITNCKFSYTYASGISLNSSSSANSGPVTVSGCEFYRNANNLYVTSVSSKLFTVYIQDNTITETGILAYGEPWNYSEPAGLSLQNCQNSIISGNDITLTIGNGIEYWQSNVAQAGNVIKNNFIHDISGHGIVYGNGLYANLSGIVHSNIIINGTGADKAGLRSGGEFEATNKGLFYNNTVYDFPIGISLPANSATANIDYKNNIIASCPIAVHSYRSTVPSALTMDNNCYYNYTDFKVNDGATSKTFAEWKTWLGGTASDDDANSITSDPLFLNAGGSFALASDVKLKSTSPARKAGTAVGLTTDFAGNPWKTPPSMGAYQYFTALDGLLWRRKR